MGELLENLSGGLTLILRPDAILAMLTGSVLGVISGAVPGLAVSVLLVVIGTAWVFDPVVAIGLALGVIVAVNTMDAIPAVLLGIPGSVSGQALIMDGPSFTRRGEARRALAANYAASLLGSTVGIFFLVTLLPIMSALIRQLGSSEFFAVAFIGITLVALVSRGAIVTGLISGFLGITLGLVGTDLAYGFTRLTFGTSYLLDGFPIVPFVFGLFAVPEIISLVARGKPLASAGTSTMSEWQQTLEGVRDAVRNSLLILRSATVGVVIGVVPGVGGSVVDWLVYTQAQLSVKGGKESFGKGDIRGIIAPGSADNALTAASLVPTLALGIPGSVTMAIFLGFLFVLGFRPGPDMMQNDTNVVYYIVIGVLFCNLVTAGLALAFTGKLTKLTFIRANLLAPFLIALIMMVGFENQFGDLLVVLGIGLLGTFMHRYGWSRPALLIAYILAPTIERYGRLSYNAYGSRVFERPQLWVVIGFSIVLVYGSMFVRKSETKGESDVSADGDQQVDLGAP